MQNKPFNFNSLLGFDRVFDAHAQELLKQATYPPHNIIKTAANNYLVELAIAGFDKSEIEIVVDSGYLTIKGDKKETQNNYDYIHRGIANRSFNKKILIAETIEVKSAIFVDGILKIFLENVIPDHKKPKRIEILSTDPQLLQEFKMNSF
jgi:molecular chaperone IbpA